MMASSRKASMAVRVLGQLTLLHVSFKPHLDWVHWPSCLSVSAHLKLLYISNCTQNKCSRNFHLKQLFSFHFIHFELLFFVLRSSNCVCFHVTCFVFTFFAIKTVSVPHIESNEEQNSCCDHNAKGLLSRWNKKCCEQFVHVVPEGEWQNKSTAIAIQIGLFGNPDNSSKSLFACTMLFINCTIRRNHKKRTHSNWARTTVPKGWSQCPHLHIQGNKLTTVAAVVNWAFRSRYMCHMAESTIQRFTQVLVLVSHRKRFLQKDCDERSVAKCVFEKDLRPVRGGAGNHWDAFFFQSFTCIRIKAQSLMNLSLLN